jgi:tetratricopeptide (TPR) repeat protein
MTCALLLVAAAGCTSNKDPESAIRSVGSGTASELNAEHSQFEKSEDPPFTVETRFAAGQLAESQNALPRAAQQYEEALKLNATHRPSAYRLAVVYSQMRQYPKAIEAWKTYVTLTDESATAYGNLGFCYELAGQKNEAESAYRQGIEREPKNQACRVNYGLMLARGGKIDEAIEQLQSVLTPAEAHYNIASVYEQQGRTEQARAEYGKALQLDPDMWEAQTRLQALK